MNLFHLKCFQVVAQENHITRAAQILNIAQPALSNIISNMEKEFGLTLFDRVGRQIQLNRNGEKFLRHVNLILSEWDAANAEINALRKQPEKYLRIAVTGQQFSKKIIMEFKIKHPSINIKQSLIQKNDIQRYLLSNKTDFVISTVPITHESISCIPFRQEEIKLLVHVDHPFAQMDRVPLNELNDEPLITLSEENAFRQLIEDIFADNDMRINVVYESFPSQFGELVSNDIGVAMVIASASESADYPENTVTKSLIPTQSRTLYLLSCSDKPQRETDKAFHRFILEGSEG